MAFASPDLHLGFGRWPAFGVSVRNAVERLSDLCQILSKAATQLTASVIAAIGSVERERFETACPIRSTLVTPRPMTPADQWTKVSAVLVRSVDGARVATEKQSAATQQLDLAQYGLITLVDELSAVMALPGRRSRTATVHAFSGSFDASDAKFRALAA